MTSLHENAKSKFAAKRYMDDILLFFLKDGWDSEKFYVTHERTVQRRVRQRTHELWMGTFTSGRARRSDSNQAFSLCPLVIRQERGMRHGAVHPSRAWARVRRGSEGGIFS